MPTAAPTIEANASALALAREVIEIEASAVAALAARIDATFGKAVTLLLRCRGRVVVTGIGKSGHIGRKIAATLASTGTPSMFVHAAEAAHGDLGMITRDDVLLALSYSGEGDELLTIVPVAKREGTPLIAMTGNADSALARLADVHLDVHVEKEACPLNLAPTSSTAAMLAFGDALAIACLDARGFGQEDFARSHPAGALGRKLLTQGQRRHAQRRCHSAGHQHRHRHGRAARDHAQAARHDGRARRTWSAGRHLHRRRPAPPARARRRCAAAGRRRRHDPHATDDRHPTRSRSKPRS